MASLANLDPEKFTRLWIEGVTTLDMAEAFSCTRHTISKTAKRLGLEPRRPGYVSDTSPEEYKVEILRLHRQGLSSNAMRQKLPNGVGEKAIATVLEAEGLTPNQRAKPGRRGGSLGGYKLSDAALALREGETLRTGCARCGAHFVGTLTQSRDWFSEHVCGEAVPAPVEPAPIAHADCAPRTQRRPTIVPRSGAVAFAVA
jgi:hypothetical protein